MLSSQKADRETKGTEINKWENVLVAATRKVGVWNEAINYFIMRDGFGFKDIGSHSFFWFSFDISIWGWIKFYFDSAQP